MPITLDVQGNKMILTVIKSDKFNFDKDRIKKVPSVRTIWKEGRFLHWAADKNEICTLLERFDVSEILTTEAGSQLIEQYKTASTPLDQLEKIEGDLDFALVPHASQEEYLRLHPSKRSMILSFDMGMGKSYAGLERAKILGLNKVIVLTPRNLKDNWDTEVRQAYGEGCLIYHGTIKQREKLRKQVAEARVVVTTYNFSAELEEFHFDSVLLDEAHIASRPTTQLFKSVDKLKANNPGISVQALTGTPVELDVTDLWGVVHHVSPEIAGTKHAWENKYVKVLRSFRKTLPSGRVIEIPIQTCTQNLDHLQQRLAPIMVRVRRNTLTKFKETTKVIHIPMTERQTELYKQIREGILIDLENDATFNSQHALTRILGLREVAEACFNLDKSWPESNKFDKACEEIEKAIKTGEKLIFWGAFKEFGKRLQAKYPKHVVLFNGDLSASTKKLSPWAFNGVKNEHDRKEYERLRKLNPDWSFDPGEALVIAGTLALTQGVGQNFEAGRRTIFPSFNYNHFVNQQAMARTQRLTQTADEVISEFWVSEGTIEAALLASIMQRANDVDMTLDGRETTSSNQTRELIKLLRSS